MNKKNTFSRYELREGQIFSKVKGRYLSHKPTSNGYCMTTVYDDDNNRHTMLYGKLMLILSDYRENWQELDCGHKNGNPLDDSLENLEWQTHQQNCKERKQMPRREQHSFVIEHLDEDKTDIFLRAKDIPSDYPIPYITLHTLATSKEGKSYSVKAKIAVRRYTDEQIIEYIKNKR